MRYRDKDLKRQAEALYEGIGINIAAAFTAPNVNRHPRATNH